METTKKPTDLQETGRWKTSYDAKESDSYKSSDPVNLGLERINSKLKDIRDYLRSRDSGID